MKKQMLCIGLLSGTILSTELFWTRLFSAEFYYTFAFLVLSLAVLGLGLGALFFTIVLRSKGAKLLPLWLSATGLMIVTAVPIVFSLNLDFAQLVSDPMQSVKLLAAILILGSGYFFGGIALAQILKTNAGDIPRLYMADFIGAALGVITFILMMNLYGASATLVYCALPVLLAAFIAAERWMKITPVVILVAGAVYYTMAGGVPEQKREERAPVVYKHWDATAKLKVYEYDSTSRGINIDNIANTPVHRFDGAWNVPDSLKVQFTIDVRNLMQQFDSCTFLSLGAGGGGDVLQALQYNASEIHAVEVIPHINYLMKDGFLREFSGNIYNDPRVIVATEDARAYARRFEKKFDVIYSLSSNSWAAFASGSFALAENYLFTTEAFMDYWRALSDRGYMSLEHQFYMPRLVTEVIAALHQLNVPEPDKHFSVYDLPTLRRKLLLISKRPLDSQTIERAYANSDPDIVHSMRRLYPPLETNKENVINTIVQSGWQTVADTARIDVSPCTDDNPFIAQLGLLRNLKPLEKIPLYEFTGFPLSRAILLIILLICTVIIVPLNLLPYLKKGEKLSARPWSYFFFIGLGYMMIEVVLIQKYALFIGSSIHSIALVLMVMLVSSGIGSRHSGRFAARAIFGTIAVWLLADVLLFKHLFYIFGDWTLVPRMALSAALIAPVGYFMGMPFPKLAVRFPDHVDWAFAVMGSASVIGSVVIVLIASSFGYSVALGTAFLMYVGAYVLYSGSTTTRRSITATA